MSHYDCRECGAYGMCDCRKLEASKRSLYWGSEALKRRHAIERVRQFAKVFPDAREIADPATRELVLCLGIVLDLAEPAATQALHFALRKD